MSAIETVLIEQGSFEWVIMKLKKGKVVERESWPWPYCIKFSKSDQIYYECIVTEAGFKFIGVWQPNKSDMVADDWVESQHYLKEMQND